MGMYDSVYVDCPKCNTSIEFQSKVGHCALNGFSVSAVPMVIAEDLHGKQERCEHCDTIVRLEKPLTVDKVAMNVIVKNSWQ